LLLIGVAFLGATYAGESARAALRKHHAEETQRPTPQMMAPQQDRTKQSRVEVVNSSPPQNVAASVGW
jgi:hypothetical protein